LLFKFWEAILAQTTTCDISPSSASQSELDVYLYYLTAFKTKYGLILQVSLSFLLCKNHNGFPKCNSQSVF